MNKKEKRIYLNPDIFYLEKINHYFDILRQMIEQRFVVHLSRPLTVIEEDVFNKEIVYFQVSDTYPKDDTYLPWEGIQRICQMEPDDEEFLSSDLQEQLNKYLENI